MRPVLIEWRGIRICAYPALTYLGLVFGIAAQNLAAKAAGLDSARVYLATFLVLPIALAGGRLLFVATHWPAYRGQPARIWRRSEGGMAMYGAVPCMLLGSLPILAWLRVPFWAFWDVSTFCILVGMIFTRTGCLLNGCCAGRPSDGPLALRLPDERGVWQRRVPTQPLEAGWVAVLLAAATVLWPWLTTPGAPFLLCLAGYGLGRLALQPTRLERQRLGRLELPLAISAAMVVLSLAGLALIRP